MTDVRTRSESLRTGLLLAGVGGFLDAYTFVGYSGVFANAQTGNIVLLGVDAQAGRWQQALLHIPPIVAFMLGVALAQTLAQPSVRKVVRRPTRWVLIAEIVVLAAAGATPGRVPSRVIPAVIAFAAAAQVSTFRSLDGVEYSSTLTTSNLRALTTNIFTWRTAHDLAARHRAALLALVTATFAVGAGVGGLCTRLIHQQAAWIAAAALMIVLVAIVIETRRLDRRGDTTPAHGPGLHGAQIRLVRATNLQVRTTARVEVRNREPSRVGGTPARGRQHRSRRDELNNTHPNRPSHFFEAQLTEGAADTRFTLDFRAADDAWQRGPLMSCLGVRFEDVPPVRPFRFEKGLRNFAGWWYFATTGTHIGFESWLERDLIRTLQKVVIR